MIEGFRLAGELKEFYGELDQISKDNSVLTVWQVIQGKRNILNGVITSYLANSKQTVINMQLEPDSEVNKGFPIFLYEEQHGILFKGEYDQFAKGTLRLYADNRVFLKEKRLIRRLNFFYTKVTCSVLLGGKIEFKDLRLKDINEGGFGIVTNEKVAKGFIQGLEISLVKISSIELPVEIKGTVAHNTPTAQVKGYKKGKYLIGVKLNQKSKLINYVMEHLR